MLYFFVLRRIKVLIGKYLHVRQLVVIAKLVLKNYERDLKIIQVSIGAKGTVYTTVPPKLSVLFIRFEPSIYILISFVQS